MVNWVSRDSQDKVAHCWETRELADSQLQGFIQNFPLRGVGRHGSNCRVVEVLNHNLLTLLLKDKIEILLDYG